MNIPHSKAAFLFLLSVLITLALTVTHTNALYEDQAGKFDWLKENVGIPKHIDFIVQKSANTKLSDARQLLFTITTANVLAAISTQTGDVVWRRSFSDNEPVHKLFVFQRYLFTLSGRTCNIVRAWTDSGVLAWDAEIEGAAATASANCDITTVASGTTRLVIVVSNGLIEARSVTSGKLVWKLADFNGKQLSLLQNDASTLSLVDADSKTKITIDIAKGSIASEEPYTGAESKSPVSGTVETSVDISGTRYTATVELTDSKQVTALIRKSSGSEVVHKITAPFDAESHGKPVKVFLQGEASGSLPNFQVFIVCEDGSVMCIQQDKIVWTREEALSEIIQSQIVDLPFKKSHRSDDNGDSLLNAVKDNSNIFSQFTARITKHIKQFKVLIATLMTMRISLPEKITLKKPIHITFKDIEENGYEPTSDDTEALPLTQDRFGFHKLIIVMTRVGKLFALHSKGGKSVWSLNVRQRLIQQFPEAANDNDVSMKFYVVRTQSHTTKSLDPELVVIAKIPSANRVVILEVDAVTGVVERVSTPNTLSATTLAHVIVSPKTIEESNIHPLVLVNLKEHKAYVYPDDSQALQLVHGQASRIYFWVADSQTGAVTGYRLMSGNTNDKFIQVELVWSANFGSNTSETSIAAVSQLEDMTNEHVHSAAHISSDGEVMHRYLNPNLFVIATFNGKRGNANLNVYFVDGVTGSIVNHAVHANVDSTAPVQITQVENAVVYQYLNSRTRQYEVASWQIFQNLQTETGSDNIGPVRNTGFWKEYMQAIFADEPASTAAEDSTRPQVSSRAVGIKDQSNLTFLHKAFIFNTPVQCATTTVTAKGITTKQFLVGLDGGHVYSIDKRLLDPRRPTLAPTAAQAEDGLLQYHPILNVNPLAMVTYNRAINKLRAIETAPAHLESTSHVFAYGLDLFYTRVAPSKEFDLLNDDFNYLLLVLTTVGLLLVTQVLRFFVANSELRRAWK